MNALSQFYVRACAVQARTCLAAGFLACVAMELSAIYFQFVLMLEPCPLCITQRLIVFALATVFAAGALHNPQDTGLRVYFGLASLIALTGAAVAVYHFAIQLLPHEESAGCGPGASYILEHFSLGDALRMFLTGTGDCTQVVWSLFGLSMPFWVALTFLGIVVFCLWRFALVERQPTGLEELASTAGAE